MQELSWLESRGEKIAVVEVPLLFEAGFERLFDKVVAVNVSRKAQLARLQKQGIGRAEALARINSQLSERQRVKKADFAINNNGTLGHALKQAEKILEQLDV